MSPARHTTHNPRHGLGSRLGWHEISTGGTTPTPDSARPESGARADWQACTTHAFLLDHRTGCTVFRAIVVYDSPNLFCGPSGSVRTGLTAVRSEPGHRTHLTSLIIWKSIYSPVKRSRENVHQPRTPNSLHFAHAVHFAHGVQNLLLTFLI